MPSRRRRTKQLNIHYNVFPGSRKPEGRHYGGSGGQSSPARKFEIVFKSDRQTKLSPGAPPLSTDRVPLLRVFKRHVPSSAWRTFYVPFVYRVPRVGLVCICCATVVYLLRTICLLFADSGVPFATSVWLAGRLQLDILAKPL